MMNLRRSAVWLACVLGVIFLAATGQASDGAQDAAAGILRATGTKGGLVVHVGCDDGRLTAALHANERFLVHGLDTEARDVRRARAHITSRDLNGPVSVAHWDGAELPYVDDLVDLLVADDPVDVSRAEIMRVLSPQGVAYLKTGNGWKKLVKPRPDDIDEWTHFLHGPGNNAVSEDAEVGPPRHMQWLADPMWCRYHHTLASISGMVSTEGRIFYVVDEAPAAAIQIPAQWFLVARDAFNGMLLWKTPIESWANHRRGFRSGPVQLPRTLVAVNDRVYLPPGLNAPLTAYDAATGEKVRAYDGTKNTEEVIVHDGYVFVIVGSPEPEQALRKNKLAKNEKTIKAYRSDSGQMVWKWSEPKNKPLMPVTLAAAGERVFFQAGQGVVCLDRDTGETLWNTDGPSKGKRKAGWSRATLTVKNGVVLWADSKKLFALSPEDGQELWSCKVQPTFHSPVDLFVVDGLVWLQPPVIDADSHSRLWKEHEDQYLRARDLHTGEVKRKKPLRYDVWTSGHHHRCYRDKACANWVMTGKRGVEFVDLNGRQHSRNNWVRGACQYGVMPCNGLLYAPAHCCGCYMEAKLYGCWSLSHGDGKNVVPGQAASRRLQKGPAYGKVESQKRGEAHSWPTYRHDALRSSSSETRVSEKLNRAWRMEIGGDLSAPVVADGKVFAACRDSHRVMALNEDDGSKAWSYTAGGPIDSPPTIHDGMALFGCADGYVYCLRASDGQLVWRFHAAPGVRRTVSRDNVESLWPVHGSVLLKDGVVYASAGRSSYLDGGIELYGLDPATGKMLHHTTVRSEHPEFEKTQEAKKRTGLSKERIDQNVVDWKTSEAPDKSDAFSMDGGNISDVLVSDGYDIYLRQMRFEPNLEKKDKKGRHLFATSRLLNPVEVHRSHWVLGTGDFSRIPVAYSWIANSRKGRRNLRLAQPYGVLLAFSSDTAWGVWRHRGYTVYAEEMEPFSPEEKPQPDFRKVDASGFPGRRWATQVPMRPRAMVRAGDLLLLGGTADLKRAEDDLEAYEGRRGGFLHLLSVKDGKSVKEYKLDAPPVWNGMAVTGEGVFMTTTDGTVVRMAPAD